MQHIEDISETKPFYKCIWYDKLQPERIFTWLLHGLYVGLCYGLILLLILIKLSFLLAYVTLGFCLITLLIIYIIYKLLKKPLKDFLSKWPVVYYWIIKFARLCSSWLNLEIKLVFHGLANLNISSLDFYYFTPSGANVWVLSVTRFKRKLPSIDKSVYKSIGATLALFDYCHRDPVSATLRFYPEIVLIILSMFMGLNILIPIISLLLFAFKTWLIYRLIYKLLYGYLLVISQNDVEYDTHPYLRTMLERLDIKDSLTIEKAWESVSVWRIVFPFLSFGG